MTNMEKQNEIKKGTCPVCNGTGRVKYLGKYKNVYGYDPDDGTVGCSNCGGQYQWGTPTGVVRLRSDGTPCVHQYTGQNIGRCYNRYTCTHCGDVHSIDSGD